MASLAQARLNPVERRVIERWIELLAAEIELDSVWLYGSRARGEPPRGEPGDPDALSDVDLLVITRGDPHPDGRRAWELIYKTAEELGANPTLFVPHTWDRAWLENRRAIRSFFIQEVDRDKIVLFGRP